MSLAVIIPLMLHVHPSSGGWTLCPLQTTVPQPHCYITPVTKSYVPGWYRVTETFLADISRELVKNISALYATKKFITVLKRAQHFSLWTQVTPSHTFFKIHFNIVLCSIPVSPKWCLLFRSSLKNSVLICLLSHACGTLLGIMAMTKFSKQYRSWSYSLCSFLQ